MIARRDDANARSILVCVLLLSGQFGRSVPLNALQHCLLRLHPDCVLILTWIICYLSATYSPARNRRLPPVTGRQAVANPSTTRNKYPVGVPREPDAGTHFTNRIDLLA